MTRTKKAGRNKKRQWHNTEGEEQGESVDDLAHAATFAVVSSAMVAAPTIPLVGKEDDDNEIEVTDEEESGSGEEDEHHKAPVGNHEKEEGENLNDDDEDDDDDDDDDSDVDLAEAVAKMQQESEAESAAVTGGPPKTEHEVDAYKTPIQELEKHLQFQLSVRDDKDGAPKLRNLNSDNLSLAGKVKHFMAVDRTVVVESNPPNNGSFSSPLDEGSLLVVRKTTANSTDVASSLIPLGRIFEVFGPVTQPLYTIRLPTPTSQTSGVAPPEGNHIVPAEVKNEVTPNHVENDGPKESDREGEESTEKNEEEKKVNQSVKVDEDSTLKEPSVSEGLKSFGEKDAADPWGPGGEFAKILSENKEIFVYFVKDESKLIDTGAIMRKSGKGCDASNLYDEEVVNSNEIYFSDDEKEREAKGRRKQSKGQKRQNQTSNDRSRAPIIPQGFYQPPPPPTGFHPTPQQPVHGYSQTPPAPHPHYPSYPPNLGQTYPPQSYPLATNGACPPPPPPPPSRPRTSSGSHNYPNPPQSPPGNSFYYQY